MTNPWEAPGLALRYVEVATAAGVVLTSLQQLRRPAIFTDTGLLSWLVHRSRALLFFTGASGQVCNVLFRYPNVLALCSIRLLCGSLLFFPLPRPFDVAACSIGFLTSALLLIRARIGNDGADLFLLMLLGALVLGRASSNVAVQEVALWFIAMQATLSYLTSGAVKLGRREWHRGDLLLRLAKGRAYGHPGLQQAVQKYPRLAGLAANLVVAGELSFPCVYIVPSPWSSPWILGGVAFHVGAAIFMGLDSFAFAFGAAYPAILHCAAYSSKSLGWR